MATTILIVEDSPRMQETLDTVLRLKGYQTLTACNGSEALAVLRSRDPRPDLVLLDLMMPGISGLDLLKLLHDTPQWKDLPVVVLSARDDFGPDLRRLGVGDYLVKSRYSTNDLLRHIRKHLAKAA
jgi:CheY-like chemotaxis protein